MPREADRNPQNAVRSFIINNAQSGLQQMFFYSENAPGSNSKINVWKMNGTKAYLRHYENLLFLQFVSTNPRAAEAEKRQARKEIALCEKKLEFWYRHPRYDHDEALRGIAELKKNWKAAA